MTGSGGPEGRVEAAFAVADDAARRETLLELLGSIDAGPDTTGPEIDALVEGIRREHSDLVLSAVWGRLAGHPNPRFRELANQLLASGDSVHRTYAVYYLGQAYPEERRELFERLENDSDPFVLHQLGLMVVEQDPRAAVEVWMRAMYDAPPGLGDETLAYLVGQYANEEVVQGLREATMNPNDGLAQIALWQAEAWNNLEYLDAGGAVEVGPGYGINCPACGRGLGIRAGHEGERGRCGYCETVFTVPAGPG